MGNWNRTYGLNITKSAERRREEIQRDLNNRTLRVVVKAVSRLSSSDQLGDLPINEFKLTESLYRFCGLWLDITDLASKGDRLKIYDHTSVIDIILYSCALLLILY